MIINAEVLMKILENVPGDFEIFYNEIPIEDTVEISVSGKKIILKS